MSINVSVHAREKSNGPTPIRCESREWTKDMSTTGAYVYLGIEVHSEHNIESVSLYADNFEKLLPIAEEIVKGCGLVVAKRCENCNHGNPAVMSTSEFDMVSGSEVCVSCYEEMRDADA